MLLRFDRAANLSVTAVRATRRGHPIRPAWYHACDERVNAGANTQIKACENSTMVCRERHCIAVFNAVSRSPYWVASTPISTTSIFPPLRASAIDAAIRLLEQPDPVRVRGDILETEDPSGMK